MTTIRVRALVALMASWALQSAAGAQTVDERIPQKDAAQEYPRWLAQIKVDGLWKPGQHVANPEDIVAANQPSIAVDSKNVVHIVYSGYDELSHLAYLPDATPPREIYYTHNRWKDRRANSWSPPVKLAATPLDSIYPDISIGPDDSIHVVWCEFVLSGPQIYYTTVAYSDADGVTVATEMPVGMSTHITPAIHIDPFQNRHIVAKNTAASPPHISYVHGPSGDDFDPSEMVTGSEHGKFPRVDFNTFAASPDVVWVDEINTIAKFSRRFGGSWGAVTEISESGAAMADLAEKDGETHFTWDKVVPPLKIHYRKAIGAGASPAMEAIEDVSLAGGFMPHIVVDSRKQPHIVWRGGAGVSYASKKNRGTSAVWGRQEPASNINQTPYGRLEICINANDNVYMTFENFDLSDALIEQPPYTGPPDPTFRSADTAWPQPLSTPPSTYAGNQTTGYPGAVPDTNKRGATFFSKMIEFDLGDQDMYGMVWAGPGTLVNATNGNVAFDLLLFAARGVGFAPAALLVYNSMEYDSGFISQGWRLNYQITATDHSEGVYSVQTGDGRTIQYVPNFALQTVAQPEFGEFSRWTNSLRITRTGIQYFFDPETGKLDTVADTNGNSLSLTYEDNLHGEKGLLSTAADNAGRTVTFTHTGGLLNSISDPAGRTYSLIYVSNRLTAVSLNGPPLATWAFSYGASLEDKNLLASTNPPLGNGWSFMYYADHRFWKSTDAMGKEGRLEYSSPSAPGGAFTAKVTDRRSNATLLDTEYKRSQVRKVTDPLGKSIQRNFDGTYRNLTSQTDRDGNATSFMYGSSAQAHDLLLEVKEPPANAPAGSGASTITAKFTYSNDIFKVTSVENAFAAKTKYHFDGVSSYPAEPAADIGAGNPTQIVHLEVPGQPAALEEMAWDGKGRMTLHTSPNGGTTSMVYGDPVTGLLTSVTRPGHATPESFTYDIMGMLTSHVLASGGVETFNYDGLYRLTSTTAAAGDEPATTTFVFDLNSNLKEVHSPGGAMSTASYDALDRLTEFSSLSAGSASVTRNYEYDEEGNVLTATDPNGHVVSASYDANHRVTTQTMPGGSGGPDISTSFAYDGEGRVLSRTTGGVTYSTTYTARGVPLSSTNPDFPDQVDETTYTDDGRVLKSVRKVAGVPKYGQKSVYDERRRLVATIRLTDFVLETGPTTTFVLDANGNVIQTIDPEGRTSSSEYDSADRLIRTIDGKGVVLSEIAYNDSDLHTSIHVASPTTGALVLSRSFTYNARNQLKTSTDFFGAVTTYTYDARGNLKRRDLPTTAEGQVCFDTFEYDLLNRVTRETRNEGTPDEISLRYGYDAAGNRTSMTDARGFVYTYVFDDSNRMIERHHPPIGAETFVESWTYDDRGNVATYTDPNGKVATWTYDLKNRPLTETLVRSGVTLASIVRIYDGSDHLVSVTDTVSRIRVSFTDAAGVPAYDALRRLTQVRWFLEVDTPDEIMWKEVKYQNPDGTPGYDDASNLTSMIDPEGVRFRYTYNANSLLKKILRTPPGGPTTVIVDFDYRPNHLRRSATFAGGTKSTWKFDDKSRLESVKSTAPDLSVLSHFRYDYDAKDRRAKAHLEHLGADVDYDYDPHDRLTGEKWKNALLHNAKWTYDAAGNRLTQKVNGVLTSYVYDAQNRLTSQTTAGVTTSYTNDRNGNRTGRTVGTSTEETFGYDYMNRITSYVKAPIGLPATTSVQHLYTPTSERVAKVDLLGVLANEQWFMYDGADVTADYRRTTGLPAFTLEKTYANGRAIDAKVAWFDALGTPTLFLVDALGSVHQEVTTAGAVVRHEVTTAWGEAHPAFVPITGPDRRYGFTGRENDNESGLMHYRRRTYDPTTGRFLSRDPVWHPNLYFYADNDPVNLTDPTGMVPWGHIVGRVGEEIAVGLMKAAGWQLLARAVAPATGIDAVLYHPEHGIRIVENRAYSTARSFGPGSAKALMTPIQQVEAAATAAARRISPQLEADVLAAFRSPGGVQRVFTWVAGTTGRVGQGLAAQGVRQITTRQLVSEAAAWRAARAGAGGAAGVGILGVLGMLLTMEGTAHAEELPPETLAANQLESHLEANGIRLVVGPKGRELETKDRPVAYLEKVLEAISSYGDLSPEGKRAISADIIDEYEALNEHNAQAMGFGSGTLTYKIHMDTLRDKYVGSDGR